MRRYTMPREAYTPKDYICLAKHDDLGIEVWGDDKTSAMAFHGKANKPDWHIKFRSTNSRIDRIADYVAAFQQRADQKVAERKAKSEWQHGLKVGDVFRSSWGYDQTNIDYYEVVAIHGKAVDVREIGQQSEDTGWLQGNCVPAPGKYISDVRRMIPQRGYNGEPSLAVYSFAHASLMKPVVVAGVPIYQESHWTAYA